ncbi:MAG: MFS transporter [Flavobacteriaceae bacterium]|jgi:predicted MFS family arabinose efflux permease|nr:MFS transporter [Flavobacteriaceae bacterium]
MLSLVILINRIGAMVVPFLSIYMTQALGFSIKETGYVLSFFGLGAVTGSWLGGWFTDKFGYFRIQVLSLFFIVPIYFILPELKTVESLAIGIFFLSVISETFRPANSVAIAYYAKPENLTKAFSLNRMAINLGFSIGPALGGILASISYYWLFYGNAVASLIAGVVFYLYFNNRKTKFPKEKTKTEAILLKEKAPSPYKDKKIMLFSLLCALYAICFFQLLTTLPLFYKEVHNLSEAGIGVILGYSGIFIVVLEMLLVQIAERRLTISQVLIAGTLLCGLSFVMLNLNSSLLMLYVSMSVLCVSEILAMPFMSTVIVKNSIEENRGAYMGLYSLSFSVAHVFSPFLGTLTVEHYGFETLWWATGILSVIVAVGLYFLMKTMKT